MGKELDIHGQGWSSERASAHIQQLKSGKRKAGICPLHVENETTSPLMRALRSGRNRSQVSNMSAK